MDMQGIERRLVRIEDLLALVLEQTGQRDPALPQGMDSQTARLITMARHDPEAAKAELRRLAKLSRITKRRPREN